MNVREFSVDSLVKLLVAACLPSRTKRSANRHITDPWVGCTLEPSEEGCGGRLVVAAQLSLVPEGAGRGKTDGPH